MPTIWLSPEEENNPTFFFKNDSVLFDTDPSDHPIKYTHSFADSEWIVFLLMNHLPTTQRTWEYIQSQGALTNKKLIALNIFHASEQMYNWLFPLPDTNPSVHFWRTQVPNNQLVFIEQSLHARDMQMPRDTIFYDMCWDRQQIYFCEYMRHDLVNRVYSQRASGTMYELSPIHKSPTAKHFLAPMRTYEDIYTEDPRLQFRKRLRHQLSRGLEYTKGYISNHRRGLILESQEWNDEYAALYNDRTFSYGGGTFWPVHNKYYEDSFVSIYVDTCVTTTGYRVITEKTWDPLIKGNFILPYGYRGMVRDIQSYGFQLPDWIDYSYDTLPDDLRFYAYLRSVEAILQMSTRTLYERYQRDKHLLEYNRNVFFTTPRTSVVEKIIDTVSMY